MTAVEPEDQTGEPGPEEIDRALADAAHAIVSGEKLSDVTTAFIQAHQHGPGWDMWVERAIVNLVHDRLRSHLRSLRGVAMSERSILAFQNATNTQTKFEVRYTVNERHEWKPLKEMTGADLRFVANEYNERANSNRLEALFFERLAAKVGDRTVGEVFTVESLELFRNAFRHGGNQI